MRTLTLKENFAIEIKKAIEIDTNTDLKEKWYGMNSTKNFGCCTYLYKKYGYPETYDEFYIKYINDDKFQDKEHGRNEEYIYKMAYMLYLKDDERFCIEDYYSYIIKKLIYDTLNGCKQESKVNDLLKRKGLRTVSPTINEDLKYGIDIKVYEKDKLLYMIQVKPNTFFIGNRNQSLINDRIKALEKEQKTKQQFGVNTYYIIYNKNDNNFILNKGKYLSHRLEELINTDGTTKNII